MVDGESWNTHYTGQGDPPAYEVGLPWIHVRVVLEWSVRHQPKYHDELKQIKININNIERRIKRRKRKQQNHLKVLPELVSIIRLDYFQNLQPQFFFFLMAT